MTLDDERLRDAIIGFRPKLVVIDPIQAYIESNSDLQIAVRARKLMRRLGMWASAYDCAVILIGHMNKKESAKGLYRSLGSIDVVAAARSVLQIERDQDDKNIRIVRQIKNSLAPSGSDLRFSIDSEDCLQWLGSAPAFEGQSAFKASDFSACHTKHEQAAELLKSLLIEKDVEATVVMRVLQEQGIGQKTIRESKAELGIRSYRQQKKWYWSLPEGSEPTS